MKLFKRTEMEKQKKAEERAMFKQLSFKKKIEHIYIYYRSVIFFTVVVVFGVGALINTVFLNRPAPTFVSVTIYGRYLTPVQRRYINFYLQRYITENFQQTHQITSENFFVEQGVEGGLAGALMQRFSAQLMLRELDLIIFHANFFDELHEIDLFLPLTYTFTADELTALSGRTIYAQYTTYGEDATPHHTEVPYAVRLTPDSLLLQLKGHGNDIYIGIIRTTRRIHNTVNTMRNLLAAETIVLDE